VDLNGQEVIFIWTALLANCALPDSGQCLSNGIRDATQHLNLLLACNSKFMRRG
jgi:hypothetical protein